MSHLFLKKKTQKINSWKYEKFELLWGISKYICELKIWKKLIKHHSTIHADNFELILN